MAEQQVLVESTLKKARKSYSREEKLKVVRYYHENGKNLYQTCKRFSMNSKSVMRWVKDEEKIRGSSKGSKRVKFDRRAQYPGMEAKLYLEYKELRKKGLKVKGWWFRLRAKQILTELEPSTNFQFSNGWFLGFKKRHRISIRRATNTCQKEPEDKRSAVQYFHRNIRRKAAEGEQIGPLGQWTPRQVANMDQTPLPFSFCDGETYTDTGEQSVWVRGGGSGLDKRQCTVQLTLFADGEQRVKPLLIFRGKGKRISFAEQLKYDRRVVVRFQPNAWCDEDIMRFWIKNCWKPSCSGPMHLVLDLHRAQKTQEIQDVLEAECNTSITYVPGGCTSLVQPVDVSFNKPFKSAVERQATQHMQENLGSYVHGQINASARRVLFTKWVGQAWEEVSADKELIIRSFKKCGISAPIDGSEDDQIHIQGLEEYTVEEEDDDYTDGDPFSDIEEESD